MLESDASFEHFVRKKVARAVPTQARRRRMTPPRIHLIPLDLVPDCTPPDFSGSWGLIIDLNIYYYGIIYHYLHIIVILHIFERKVKGCADIVSQEEDSINSDFRSFAPIFLPSISFLYLVVFNLTAAGEAGSGSRCDEGAAGV